MTEKSELLKSLRIERDSEPESEASASPRWPLIIAGVVGALVIGVGAGWFLKPTPAPPATVEETTDTATTGPAAGSTSAGGLVASGYVVARRQATVAAEVTARVLDVRVDEGQNVRRGEILATLEPTLARAELQSARDRAVASDADFAEAQRVLARTQTLNQQGFASSAALTAAQARASQAEATRNAAHSDANAASVTLGRYLVRAPFDGVITDKAAQAGEIISPLSAGGGFTRTGICTIVDMTSREIEVDVSESYIARVKEGQHVDAVLDAYPDVTFPAHVIATIPTADRSRATVRVRIGFDQLDPRILPEMAIKVTFRDQPS